jgi:hypothetical protein
MMAPMEFEHSVRYDASVAEVYAMLTDVAFREKASWEQDAVSVDASVEDAQVRIEMSQPNTAIPALARAIAGENLVVVQEEAWDEGVHAADFTLTIPGKPGGINGVRRLVADGASTLDTFKGESKVKIPLIGGKIETLIASRLNDGWDIEHGVGIAWLKGER